MDGLIADNFAGGGGASLGIQNALGRPIDIAINHDPEALAMHRVNHPDTTHYGQNIWQVDPCDVAGGRRIDIAWFSPDCSHFSKAKGGRPVKRHIRDLAWIVVLWAKRVRPSIIFLENVEEFRGWGPLGADSLPCRERRGQTFNRWVDELRRLGYRVEWRELRACDYGTPTIRRRLFVIARCDGKPIAWPEPTHGPDLLPYRTAADCIDWSHPCPSIFLTKEEGRAIGVKRPLAHATMQRIAHGVVRYVLDSAEPFIVPVIHKSDLRSNPATEPLRTITTERRAEHAMVALDCAQHYDERKGQSPRCQTPERATQTSTPTTNSASFVAAFLAQHNTGMVGHHTRRPLSTIVQRGTTQAVVCAALSQRSRPGSTCAAATTAPRHHALVAAFITKYYGDGGQWQMVDRPSHTIPTRDRMGLVTVTIAGLDYVITDIGMRMLTPRELFRAQGFEDCYIIDPVFNGKKLTKTAQIRMCGNSVCPQVAEAVVRANIDTESKPADAAMNVRRTA